VSIRVSLSGVPWQKSVGPRPSTSSVTLSRKPATKSRFGPRDSRRRPRAGATRRIVLVRVERDPGVERIDELAVGVATHEERAVGKSHQAPEHLGRERSGADVTADDDRVHARALDLGEHDLEGGDVPVDVGESGDSHFPDFPSSATSEPSGPPTSMGRCP